MPEKITRRTFLQGAAAAVVLLGCGATVGVVGREAIAEFITHKRVLRDDIGREVTLPVAPDLRSVYFTSPLAQVFCFTLAPHLLAGTSMKFSPEQLEFLPEGSNELDFLGSLSQGGLIDTDMLRYKGVQVVLSISGAELTDVNIEMALDWEAQSNIPVFLIDGSFERIGETYRLLGACLGCGDRAEELVAYCEDVYQDVRQAVAGLTDSQRVRYYYGEGPDGLLTESDVSEHSLAFRVAGGHNVFSSVELQYGQDVLVPVTSQQVAQWDPDFIILGDKPGQINKSEASSLFRSLPAYSGLRAVQAGQVFQMPSLPFAFCDRPPGVNRFLGIQWLANLFYPKQYDVDMVDVVCKFYEKCYWRKLSREQAKRILNPQ